MYPLIFLALPPHIIPVNHGLVPGGCTDDLQHPFGRVGVQRTRVHAVSFEVACEGAAVLANLTKVDGFAPGSEEEETVEFLH